MKPYLLFLTILFFSLKFDINSQHRKGIIYKTYGISERHKKVDTAYYEIRNKKHCKEYIYWVLKDTSSKEVYHYISIPKNDKDTIKYMEWPITKNGSNTYKVKNRNFEVFNFQLDVENMYDEESEIFFSKKYGIHLILNIAWDDLYVMEYDDLSQEINSRIISNNPELFNLVEF